MNNYSLLCKDTLWGAAFWYTAPKQAVQDNAVGGGITVTSTSLFGGSNDSSLQDN